MKFEHAVVIGNCSGEFDFGFIQWKVKVTAWLWNFQPLISANVWITEWWIWCQLASYKLTMSNLMWPLASEVLQKSGHIFHSICHWALNLTFDLENQGHDLLGGNGYLSNFEQSVLILICSNTIINLYPSWPWPLSLKVKVTLCFPCSTMWVTVHIKMIYISRYRHFKCLRSCHDLDLDLTKVLLWHFKNTII